MSHRLPLHICGLFVFLASAGIALAADPAPATAPATRPAVTFNTRFEGGSLAKIEVLGVNAAGREAFRCFVAGQHDQRGRNRQANWEFFQMSNVRGRELSVTLTDLVGEYNDRPGALPWGPDIIPVFSNDRKTWTHFDRESAVWDAEKKELTLNFKPAGDTIWIAHLPPYVPSDLTKLLEEIGRLPHVRIEWIGKTLGGRDMPMVTVTDFSAADAGKRCIWLQARQHAWEAGTSWAMEGALRLVTSDDPKAIELRKRMVFRFTPMADLDGCATGQVRFNGNGYDFNRNWLAVDLRDPEKLRLMPEIWYTKKAIAAAHAAGPKIDLMVNLHNTETGEYLQTFADEEEPFGRFQKLFDRLVERSTFDPSTKLAKPQKGGVVKPPSDTANSLWATHGVPVALMELRVGTVKKLGRRRTVEDWQKLGRELISEMAEAVR